MDATNKEAVAKQVFEHSPTWLWFMLNSEETDINYLLLIFPWKGFDCRLSQLLPLFLAFNQLASGIGLESSWEPYRTGELIPGCFPLTSPKNETKSPSSPRKKLSIYLTSQLCCHLRGLAPKSPRSRS